jgi:hypothetical protein
MANNNTEGTKNTPPTNPPETPTTTPENNQPEMVQIPKEQLEKLMNLVPAVEQLQKDNEALTFAADRARLEIFNERQQVPGNRTVKLSTYLADDGKRKVVVAWVMLPGGQVFKAESGAWIDTQEMELLFEDDTKKKLPLLTFYRNTAEKIKAEVLEDKGDSFKVKTAEGKEYLIGKMFVN